MSFKSIRPRELFDRMQAGEAVNLVDVRSPAEFEEVRAKGARSVPLDTLTPELAAKNGEPVYVICKSGGRSASACAFLISQGLTEVVNVDGGTMAWQGAGLPVERSTPPGGEAPGKQPSNWIRPLSLLALLICVTLGIFVNPAFTFVAGAVWIGMILTGQAPCCCSGSCETRPRAATRGPSA